MREQLIVQLRDYSPWGLRDLTRPSVRWFGGSRQGEVWSRPC